MGDGMNSTSGGFARRSKRSRGIGAVLALLVVSSLQVAPAFAGSASPGDTVIDNFTAGSGSWLACGNYTFNYFQDPSIIGGARELALRDGGSCHYGPNYARMAVNATQGTASWYGSNTYAAEQHFSYGTEIGTYTAPWSPSPNIGKGTPLNLALNLSDQIVIQMVSVDSNINYDGLQIRLRDANTNTYTDNIALNAGTNLVPLSSFSGLTAAAAAHIDGISFSGGDKYSPGNVVSLFAIRSGDTTPPTATPSQTPAANANGWNNTDVSVNWNWTDSGSGVNSSNCTTSSTATGEGVGITLSATCSDNAGNIGTASYAVNIDRTPPVVVFSGNAGTYTVAQSVTITCSATDVLSGVAGTDCPAVSGSAWSFGLGTHTLTGTATDKAGNVGSSSTSYTVTVDEASLCSLTQEFSTSSGVAGGLCAKLNAAAASQARGQLKTKANDLTAYENQVTAQSGKALTSDQANLLIEFAATL